MVTESHGSDRIRRCSGIMKLLREFAGNGTAVLMATHDRVAVEFADRVVTMEDGRLAGTAG